MTVDQGEPMLEHYEKRRFASRRCTTGLYLQSSNDGERWYVIAAYEDGRAYGLDHGPQRERLWSWGPISLGVIDAVSSVFSEETAEDMLRDNAAHELRFHSRREAIDAALKFDASNEEMT